MYPHCDLEVCEAIDNLSIFTIKKVRKRLTVTEYVDVTTGEIVPAGVAQKLGIRSIRPDAQGRRERKLGKLRGEPRRFAEFLLRFRDRRCKFLMPMDMLVGWYSTLTGKKPHHIRRYYSSLIGGGILEEGLMLNEDFMINNPRAGKGAAKGDTFRAYNVFDGLLLRNRG